MCTQIQTADFELCIQLSAASASMPSFHSRYTIIHLLYTHRCTNPHQVLLYIHACSLVYMISRCLSQYMCAETYVFSFGVFYARVHAGMKHHLSKVLRLLYAYARQAAYTPHTRRLKQCAGKYTCIGCIQHLCRTQACEGGNTFPAQ